MNIVAFGASISNTSINKAFAHFVASSLEGHDINLLDLNSFPLPAFSVDIEKEPQYVAVVQDFISTVQIADLLIISMAEHNRSMTAAFKSLIDWSSRVQYDFLKGKKILLLSTSPGGFGGQNSLGLAIKILPMFGAEIINTFPLPKFYENFSQENGIVNEDLGKALEDILADTKAKLEW